MGIFAKCFLISCAVCAGTAVAVRAGDSWDDRDFHGSWKLSRADSEFHTLLPVPPPETMDIEQKGTVLHCRMDGSREEVYSTNRKETVNKIGRGVGKTVCKWEGASLLFDTLVDGETEENRYTLMDRWKLVKEGRRLLIHREIVRRRGEVEADLVYDKQ